MILIFVSQTFMTYIKVANVEKKVPREWINEAGDYVTDEFVNYIRPLIQAELTLL